MSEYRFEVSGRKTVGFYVKDQLMDTFDISIICIYLQPFKPISCYYDGRRYIVSNGASELVCTSCIYEAIEVVNEELKFIFESDIDEKLLKDRLDIYELEKQIGGYPIEILSVSGGYDIFYRPKQGEWIAVAKDQSLSRALSVINTFKRLYSKAGL